MVQGRVGLDRFSASNSSSSQHSSAESTQDSAQCSHVEALLTGLESGCTWATDIGAKTPQVPREFDDFLRLSRQEPSPFVVEQLYTPEAVDVPAKVRHVLYVDTIFPSTVTNPLYFIFNHNLYIAL